MPDQEAELQPQETSPLAENSVVENSLDLTQPEQARNAARERGVRERETLTQDRQDAERRGNSTALYAVMIVTALVLLGIFIHSLSQGVGQTQTPPTALVNRPAPPAPSLPAPVQLAPSTTPVGANGLPTTGTAATARTVPAPSTVTPGTASTPGTTIPPTGAPAPTGASPSASGTGSSTPTTTTAPSPTPSTPAGTPASGATPTGTLPPAAAR